MVSLANAQKGTLTAVTPLTHLSTQIQTVAINVLVAEFRHLHPLIVVSYQNQNTVLMGNAEVIQDIIGEHFSFNGVKKITTY